MDNLFTEIPRSPQFGEITHMTVDISWKDDFERILKTSGGKPMAELCMRGDGIEDWQNIYKGYDVHFTKKNLESESTYRFRLRFRSSKGTGDWSNELVAKTLKSPLTGNDIHRTVRQGDAAKLREILTKNEANIEAPDNLGFTPLMFAAQRNMLDMVEILIEWNANPNTQNDTGKTALMFASFKGNLECMETLLESGSDVKMADQNGLTALHMAADGEQTRAIKLLVKAGADLEARDNSMGWTPLLRCAGLKNNGNVDVACELIRSGAQVDALDNDGKTPLHNCIINSHQQLCRLFLSYGASVELITKNGYNATQLAESIGNTKILQVFKECLPKERGDDQ